MPFKNQAPTINSVRSKCAGTRSESAAIYNDLSPGTWNIEKNPVEVTEFGGKKK